MQYERNEGTTPPVYDIPDGNYKLGPLDPDNKKMCAMNDGVNILGTHLGSPEFIADCLKCKVEKQTPPIVGFHQGGGIRTLSQRSYNNAHRGNSPDTDTQPQIYLQYQQITLSCGSKIWMQLTYPHGLNT